jgi:hypothetical protein
METRPIISKGKNRLAYLFCYIRKIYRSKIQDRFFTLSVLGTNRRLGFSPLATVVDRAPSNRAGAKGGDAASPVPEV